MKYTAEEVRAMASDLRGAPGTSMIGTHISLPTARAVAIYEALCAYAERIKADKGVVTDVVVEIAAEAHMRVRGLGMHAPWQTMTEETRIGYRKAMRAALLAVWPSPPAQAAQPVDVAKVRRVAADIRHWNEAICHPALNVFADELEAAVEQVNTHLSENTHDRA